MSGFLGLLREASGSISEVFVIQHPKVPWQDMADFIIFLVYEYFRVNTDIICSNVERELLKLKRDVERILQELEGTEP